MLLAWHSARAADHSGVDWTGCHVGAYAGGAFGGHATTTDRGDAQGAPWNQPLGNHWSYPLHGGVLAGGLVGCDYQTASPVVLGLGAELGYLNLSGSGIAPASPHGDTSALSRIGHDYAVIAPRAGWSWDHSLLYVKAGLAIAGERASVVDSCDVLPCGGGLINATSNRTETGWAAGAGVEYALSQRWTVRAEYLYLGLDEDTTACGTASAGLARGSVFCFGQRGQGVHTLKLGIAYRFWTPSAP